MRLPSPLPVLPALLLALVLALPGVAGAEAASPDDSPRDCESDVCFLDTGIDRAVSLAWLDLEPRPLPRWIRYLPEPWQEFLQRLHQPRVDRTITLLVRNRRDRALRAEVRLHPWGLRREARLPELDVLLGPRGHRKLRIPIAALGYDLSRPHSLVALTASVQIDARIGHSSDAQQGPVQTLSPTLYLQRSDPRSAALRPLSEDQLDELVNRPAQAGAMNPLCTLTIPPPDDPGVPESFEVFLDPGGGDPEPGQVFTVDPPAGEDDIKFCFALPVHTVDAGIGEDFGINPVTNYPASYAEVTIVSLPPGSQTVVDAEYLDADGCIEFEHVQPAGYSVKLAGRASVPSSSDPTQRNRIEVTKEDLSTPAWYWCSDEAVEEGDVHWFYASPNRRTNLLALSTFSLVRFSDGFGSQIIYVQDRPCSSSPTNSCNSAPGSAVQINPDHNQYRYAIAHEMGHFVVHRFMGGHPLLCGAYTVNAGGEACEWDLSHALHSKELSASAITEGFAQFYATAVFNRLDEQDGWFHYYKDDYKDGAVTVVDMNDDLVGGTSAYLETICDGPVEGFGVELDWARQFWDYMTDPGVKPTRLQLLEQLDMAYNQGGWDLGNAAERMGDVVTTHAAGSYADRWHDLAVENGVDPSFATDCGWFCPLDCGDPCTEASCPCSSCAP